MASKQFQIYLSLEAKKDFAKFDKFIQKWLVQKLEKLRNSPNPMARSAKLVGHKDIYRHRFGDYRLIFTVDKQGNVIILVILSVKHRKDAYNNL